MTGKDSKYNFFWVGNNYSTNGVGMLQAEQWIDKVYDIKLVSDRIILIKLLVEDLSSQYYLPMIRGFHKGCIL